MSSETRHYVAGQSTSFLEECRELFATGHLLWSLVHRDLTVRYKRSVLGFFWTMLHPLMLTIILTIVFSNIFRFTIPHYETYVLAALLPWNFFSQTTVTAMHGVAWNGPLMKRVRVPKSVFTLSTVLSGIVNLALSYVPLLAIMLVRGAPIRGAALFLPVSVLLFAIFTWGVALAFSSITIYFSDVREMYTVALMALMYLTPVIYPREIIPARWAVLLQLNPLTYFIDIVRTPIHSGVLPSAHSLLVATIAALVSAVAGWTIFRRLSRGFYPYL
ncbi:MAG TPA: ABC transporter permease [Thermoanaerobaculia bacterium]|nr:ABC transporter permease [Thermoanaerobaculia bacterium]